MKFTDITDKVKHIGKHTNEEMTETSTTKDEPVIFADNENERKTLEGVFYE